jgi:zinc protease
MKKQTTLLASFILACTSLSASAVEIQELTSAKGIPFWLVESHSIPMVSASASFRSGSAFDTKTTHGLSAITAAMLTEGTKKLNNANYKESLERLGSSVGASSGRENITLSMQSLSENSLDTFKLMADTAYAPRIQKNDFSRIQTHTLEAIKRSKESSSSIASEAYRHALYGNHGYAFSGRGTEGTVSNFTAKQLKEYAKSNLTCNNMSISIVGDVTAETAMKFVDKSFGKYCDNVVINRKKITEEFATPTPSLTRIYKDVPQSQIYVGHKGITRQDADYFASYVMNYILGGGGFNARLMKEIREKRGLAYGAYSYFNYAPLAGNFTASSSTKNETAMEVVRLLKLEMAKMAEKGATKKEFDGALQYLTGSFPLRLDSNDKILNYLTVMQMENLGVDYLDTWQSKVGNVTLADVNRVAVRLLKPEVAVVVIVGGEK